VYRRLASRLFSVCILCGWAMSFAHGTELPDQFRSYLESKPFKLRLIEAAITTDAYRRLHCTDYDFRGTTGFEELKPVVMPPGAQHPESGIWRSRFTVISCGEMRSYSAVFSSRPGLHPRMVPSHPGTTGATAQLARDMRSSLSVQAMQAANNRDCKDVRLVDTKMQDEKRDFVEQGVKVILLTHELWSVDVCGTVVDLNVTFLQRAGVPGTSYTISQSDSAPRKSISATEYLIPVSEVAALLDRIVAGDTAEPVAVIQRRAQEGQPVFQYLLAILHREGKGVAKDPTAVAYWALRAAYNGERDAMDLVGTIYTARLWIVQDFDVAEQWYRRAVAKGRKASERSLVLLALMRERATRGSEQKGTSKSLSDFLKPSQSPAKNDTSNMR